LNIQDTAYTSLSTSAFALSLSLSLSLSSFHIIEPIIYIYIYIYIYFYMATPIWNERIVALEVVQPAPLVLAKEVAEPFQETWR